MLAEIGQAHDGSLGAAHAYIDAVAEAGADAVKFQTHIAAAESTPGEPWRVEFSRQDATRYEYWRRMELTRAQWRGLHDHAGERGLVLLSTPFSLEAVELLDELPVPAWKVGSGEVGNEPLLARMAATGRPVLLSSGLSTWSELDAAVATVRSHGAPVAVLQCTTAYPCPPERLGLNLLGPMRQRYRCPVGLSDHSGTVFAGLAAAALGAHLLEVHVTFSRRCFGPDVPASVTPEELSEIVRGVRFVHAALSHPQTKDELPDDLAALRKVFAKSVVAAHALPAGHCLETADLALKKPGTGIAAGRLPELVGRRLRRAVEANTLLSDDDFA